MNITLPLRFLEPVKMSVPKLCRTVTQTEKVKIEATEDKQFIFVKPGAIIFTMMDMDDNDTILMVWHMLNDGVCEVDFGVKIDENLIGKT